MAANTRHPVKVEQDRTEIARRLARGEKQVEIAQVLSLSRAMVSYEVKAIQREWQRAFQDFNQAKLRELAKLDEAERIAWQKFEKSKRTVKHRQSVVGSVSTPDNPNPAPLPATATLATQEGAGNPRYLNTILKCIERRTKLLGLTSPFKTEPSEPADNTAAGGFLTPEQRAQRLVELLGLASHRDKADSVPPATNDLDCT